MQLALRTNIYIFLGDNPISPFINESIFSVLQNRDISDLNALILERERNGRFYVGAKGVRALQIHLLPPPPRFKS